MPESGKLAVGGRLLPAPRKPLLLIASLLAGGAVALSVHVAMLAWGVPFPLHEAPGWARWIYLSIVAGGVLVFLGLAAPRTGRLGVAKRTLLAFAILATLQETLRAAIMTGVVTGGWVHPAVSSIVPLVRTLILAWLCVVAVRWVRGGASLVVVALATGGLAMAAHHLVGAGLAPLREYAATFARDALYPFPYPPHVTAAAYFTFIEAVVGATLMTMLVWDRLPAARTTRLLQLALMAAVLKGVVGGTFVYGFFTGPSAWAGMFSWSQFLLEFLVLGLLTGLAWQVFGHRAEDSAVSGRRR